MKRAIHRNPAIYIIIAAVLFIFNACSDKNNLTGPEGEQFTSADFAVIDQTDIINSINDGTIDSDITIDESINNYNFTGLTGNFTPENQTFSAKGWFVKFDFTKHIGAMLRKLDLTDQQKVSVKGFFTTFHTNMKPLVKAYLDSNSTIIKNANASRKLIVDSVKSGLLTRLQGAAAIAKVNKNMRDLIAANPATVEIVKSMRNQRVLLFQSIAGILDAEQLKKWNQMLAVLIQHYV